MLSWGENGCALRATTDFGPQSQSSTRSLSAGPQGLPGVTATSRPDSDTLNLHGFRGEEAEEDR